MGVGGVGWGGCMCGCVWGVCVRVCKANLTNSRTQSLIKGSSGFIVSFRFSSKIDYNNIVTLGHKI